MVNYDVVKNEYSNYLIKEIFKMDDDHYHYLVWNGDNLINSFNVIVSGVIITICGDTGTYTFTTNKDNFKNSGFTTDKLHSRLLGLTKKLQSSCIFSGHSEFDIDSTIQVIKEEFDYYMDDLAILKEDTEEYIEKKFRELIDSILYYQDADKTMELINEFDINYICP